ncbi:hypothetical protein N8T08_007951 [Aspergillus melleus]|uniref:Uncharacterized protein n=1 Tax=Aspergillus melleus TaxID=138277 RepID=A0ACC3AWV1_9EURO|nr:hypothetical protein N8T08_007951 [Aspergillus melleus]
MPLAKAILSGTVLAESPTWESVEGNVYFPPSALKNKSQFSATDLTTYCSWKGTASYYSVTVGDETIPNVAWYYAEPYDAALNIKDHIAFYKSKVEVVVE